MGIPLRRYCYLVLLLPFLYILIFLCSQLYYIVSNPVTSSQTKNFDEEFTLSLNRSSLSINVIRLFNHYQYSSNTNQLIQLNDCIFKRMSQIIYCIFSSKSIISDDYMYNAVTSRWNWKISCSLADGVIREFSANQIIPDNSKHSLVVEFPLFSLHFQDSLSILSDLITTQASNGVDLTLIIFKAAILLKHLGSFTQAIEYLEFLIDDPPEVRFTCAIPFAFIMPFKCICYIFVRVMVGLIYLHF